MALLLKTVLNGYRYLVEDLGDPRTEHYPMARSPIPVIAIMVGYILVVKKIGPMLMENRQPFDLKKILVVYNFLQMCTCGYIVYMAFPAMLKLDWRCAPITYSKEDVVIPHLAYIYFLTKIADTLDTVFFIMRKKANQVTFLHVYHHTVMMFIGWLGVKCMAGGHAMYMPYVNCVVHVVMYFYYLLSAYDETYKSNLWWKKHITQLQLFQFAFDFFIYFQLFFRPSCTFPKVVLIGILPQSLVMTILFSDFYYKTYIKKRK